MPLYAESVFFGGDYWFTLLAQPMAPPKQSKRNRPIKTYQGLYQSVKQTSAATTYTSSCGGGLLSIYPKNNFIVLQT